MQNNLTKHYESLINMHYGETSGVTDWWLLREYWPRTGKKGGGPSLHSYINSVLVPLLYGL